MNVFEYNAIETIFVVGMVMLVPIVTVVGIVWALVARSRNDKNLRQSIVENNVSPELAKLLIEERDSKTRLFTTLRWGSALLGLGIGGILAWLLSIDPDDDLLFFIIVMAGMGLGLLVAFIIEMRMRKKMPKDAGN